MYLLLPEQFLQQEMLDDLPLDAAEALRQPPLRHLVLRIIR